MTRNIEEPLKILLHLWAERVDLRDAFPEAIDGDYRALINWAEGVSSKAWADPAVEILFPFKKWYSENKSYVERPKNEELIREILKKTKFQMDNSLKYILESSDINEHLSTLYFITIEFDLKRILELGVRDGNSTVIFTEAASRINGHVWSVDVNDCNAAKQKINSMGLNNFWTFTQGNDMEIGKNWKDEMDHIFIDTSHAYQHTLNELNIYEKFLSKNGFFSLHDTRVFPGVLKAVNDFLENSVNEYSFYPYFNNNGLAILRRIK